MLISELLQHAAQQLKLHYQRAAEMRAQGLPEDEVLPVEALMDGHDVRRIAEDLFGRVTEYRKNAPPYFIQMYADSLEFLETLCRKHMGA